MQASESLFLGFLAIVEVEFDDGDSGMALHFGDDGRQSRFTNLLQLGQFASTEHNLGKEKQWKDMENNEKHEREKEKKDKNPIEKVIEKKKN